MKRRALILIAAISLVLCGCGTANPQPSTADSSSDTPSTDAQSESTNSQKETEAHNKSSESSVGTSDTNNETSNQQNTSAAETANETIADDLNNDQPTTTVTENYTSEPTPVSQFEIITFTLYTPNSNSDGLDTQSVMLPGNDETSVFSILKAHNVIKNDVSLNYLNESIHNGEKTLLLDLSTAFTSQLDSSGSSQAQLTIASIVNTYLDAYNSDKILITGGGGGYLAGAHYDLNYYQYYFDININSSTITLHLYDDFSDSFYYQSVNVESITATSIIKALSQEGILDSSVTVYAFNETDVDGSKLITLDLSEAFITQLQRQGSSGIVTINRSLGNTFLNIFGAENMQITVNGVPPVGAHYDYNYYLTYYETSNY